MSRRIMRFDPPDRFIAGAIGEPGRRVFHLQAIGGGIAATVIVGAGAGVYHLALEALPWITR